MIQNIQHWAQTIRSCRPAAGCHLLAGRCGDKGKIMHGVGLDWGPSLCPPPPSLCQAAVLGISAGEPKSSVPFQGELRERTKPTTNPSLRGCRFKVKLWFWLEANRIELCGKGGMRFWSFSSVCQVPLNPSGVILSLTIVFSSPSLGCEGLEGGQMSCEPRLMNR